MEGGESLMDVWVVSDHSYSATTGMWCDFPFSVFSSFEKAQEYIFKNGEKEEYWDISQAFSVSSSDMIYTHEFEDGSIEGYMIEKYVVDEDYESE